MTAPTSIAVNLAVLALLLRDRSWARDEQAAAFRALDAALGGAPIHIHARTSDLLVNGQPVSLAMPGISELRSTLRAHGIGELEIPVRNDAVLLALLQALAAPPGSYPTIESLLDHLDAGTRAGVRIRPPAPDESDQEPAGLEAAPEATRGSTSGPNPLSFRTTNAPRTPARLSEVLQQLTADPGSPLVSDWLNEVVAGCDRLVREEKWDELVQVGLSLIECEHAVAGEPASRAYPIALRRILSRNVLGHIGRLIVTGSDRPATLRVLQRMGADATEVLLTLLAAGESIEERRSYYNALREMAGGAALFAGMLMHDEWYVVRNVADLCGDLRLEEAVPQLSRRLAHPDERVRRSVAAALAKIGTASTVEPLRQALRDPARSVRLQAARGLDGWRSRALAMTLAVLLDEEPDPEISREMMLALGRIGTPEALQALSRAAEPGGRLFSRKPQGNRLAAVDGLRTAGPAAAPILQSLLHDDDTEVRSAAAKALAHVTA
jgi:HEAT repeat protein